MAFVKHPVSPKLKGLSNRALPLPLKLLACAAIVLGVFSCGGTGQDNGRASNESQVVGGLVIDGYLARSLVFIDYDNNKTRDPWEPYAFTDDEGYFSFNRKTNTDYCAAHAPDHQKIFCLRTSRSLNNRVIRIDGGYDVLTGEPFYGQLSRRVAANASRANNALIISPFTSLLTDVDSNIGRAAILTALGLDENDLDEDYLDPTQGINTQLLGSAIKLHKVISLMSQAMEDSYGELGSQVGAMNDASALIYKHLAFQLANGYHNLDAVTATPSAIADILADAELEVLDYYDRWEVALPNQIGMAMEPSSLAERTTDLSRLINGLLARNADSQDLSRLTGSIKLIEAMAIKAAAPAESLALRNSVNFLLDDLNQEALHNLTNALAEANSDLASVARRDLSAHDLSSPESVRAIAQLPAGATAFRDLAGQQLRVSDMDLGSPPNHLRDSEVEFYFYGDRSETQGAFTACVKYIKDASSDGKLGDANTRGELVKGYWSLLGASQNAGASYSLLLTLDFLGSRYQAILKPAGLATLNDQEMHGIRFDYANELRTWYSPRGLETIEYTPRTADDCVRRLPSRIGI